MKKITLIALLLSLLVIYPLVADITLSSVTFTPGYSEVSNSFVFGIEANYAYYMSVNKSFAFGIGTKADIPLTFGDLGVNIGCAFLVGPSFLFTVEEDNISLSITPGFSMYNESGLSSDFEYMGLGPGLDIGFSYIPSGSGTGFTLGLMNYFELFDFADSAINRFKYIALPYFGISVKVNSSTSNIESISYNY